jgi:hypothetical protein
MCDFMKDVFSGVLTGQSARTDREKSRSNDDKTPLVPNSD